MQEQGCVCDFSTGGSEKSQGPRGGEVTFPIVDEECS